MNLLHDYDNLSTTNNLAVVGIDLVHESAEQWDLLSTNCFNDQLVRLMAWMKKEEWIPILDHGTLYMGVVNNPGIKSVVYRLEGCIEIPAVLTKGYWRPTTIPIPLDSLDGTLEVNVKTSFQNIELVWLIVPCLEHQQQFAAMEPKEFLVSK